MLSFMGMASTATTFDREHERPRAVIVFVTALGAFMLAAFATFNPQESFPWAIAGLPFVALMYGVLALGIWNRSRFWWVVNAWIAAGLLFRSAAWFVSADTDSIGGDFSQSLLRTITAIVLLNLLFTPSLFRWIWSKEPHSRAI